MNCYDLKTLPTRVLMKYREKSYKTGNQGYDPTDNHNHVIPIAAILKELGCREHVPNKKEAKIIRQQRAK